MAALPHIEIYTRSVASPTAHSVDLLSSSFSSLPLSATAPHAFAFSRNGALVAMPHADRVDIMDADTKQVRFSCPISNVFQCDFSPCSLFVLTVGRRADDNVHVWSMEEGKKEAVCVYSCAYRIATDRLSPSDWPVQFSPDGSLVAHRQTSQIALMNVNENKKSDKLKINMVINVAASSFSFSPVPNPDGSFSLFTFTSGRPGSLAIRRVPRVASGHDDGPRRLTDAPMASRQIFQTDEVRFCWSPIGQAVLCETATATDQTGKSYYGESGLHLIMADGSYQGSVDFKANPGPVQDFAWSPSGREFLVIQGFQPAKLIMYALTENPVGYKPVKEFGTLPRNTIRFSPHGRFLVLGGFGNLAGEMDFWDVYKFRLLGSAQDRNGAKSYEWTPDGRRFVTAVTRPWRRVDNQLKVFTYYGELLHTQLFPELYQVQCRPALDGIFPNQPQSPRLAELRKKARDEQGKSVNEPVKLGQAKSGAYVPPHLRGSGQVNAVAQQLQQEKANTGPKKIDEENGGLTKNQLKAQKKKERKAKQAEAGPAEEEDEEALAAAAAAAAEAEAARVAAEEIAALKALGPDERAKRAKALKKRLKQIDDLKAKLASGAVALDADLKEKIASEEKLKKHVQVLEG